MFTGTRDGEPAGTSLILLALTVPFDVIWWPSDIRAPLKSTMPPTPVDGSTKPVDARSRCPTSSFAFRGVSDASVASIGPAFPSTFTVPSPGVLALKVNGNCDEYERSDASSSTDL